VSLRVCATIRSVEAKADSPIISIRDLIQTIRRVNRAMGKWMRRLDGKTALITGAAKGLGAAMAQRFADEGATVIVNDLTLEDAQNVAVRVDGHAVAGDVSDPASVAAMFKEISRLVPRLDILVNNAGISGLEFGDVDELIKKRQKQIEEISTTGKISTFIDVTISIADEHWRRVQAVHVDGTFHCCREALKLMNTQMNGSIINIASVTGTSGKGGNLPYVTAKAAILGLTRALATEVGPRGIRVNAIAPGWIETDMTVPIKPLLGGIAAQTPLLRLGTPDDVAWAAVFLASDETKFMTGQVLAPNGGFYMSQ
jgi:3-oxoacyl-[acyl-carrier protein] reductase